MVKDKDVPGDGGVVGKRAGLAVEGVGEAQVEPDGAGAGEGDVLSETRLLEGSVYVVRQAGQFGRLVGAVEFGYVDCDHVRRAKGEGGGRKVSMLRYNNAGCSVICLADVRRFGFVGSEKASSTSVEASFAFPR